MGRRLNYTLDAKPGVELLPDGNHVAPLMKGKESAINPQRLVLFRRRENLAVAYPNRAAYAVSKRATRDGGQGMARYSRPGSASQRDCAGPVRWDRLVGHRRQARIVSNGAEKLP